jgi:hypothetical protein
MRRDNRNRTAGLQARGGALAEGMVAALLLRLWAKEGILCPANHAVSKETHNQL